MPFHFQAQAGDISRYVLAPGDQGRARKVVACLQDAYLVAENRGYLIYSGSYEGTFLTVCATGMGGPAVAIVTEELAQLGAEVFIRVGSCGALQPGIGPGDLVVATGSVRLGGTANAYLPVEYPAVPSFPVLRAVTEAAEELALPLHHGVVATCDAFYGPATPMEQLKLAHVLAIEMESDTLFVLGQYRGWRTGAIFTADGTMTEIKPAWGEESFRRGEGDMIRVALRAARSLAVQDGEAAAPHG